MADLTTDERLQLFIDRFRAIERNHHLITPAKFTPMEYARRDQLLAKMNWEMNTAMWEHARA